MRIPVWAVVILALLFLVDVGFRATQFVTERRVTLQTPVQVTLTEPLHFEFRDFEVRKIESQSRSPAYWQGRGNLVVKEAAFREKNLVVFVIDTTGDGDFPYGRFVQTIAVEKGIGTLTTFDPNGPRKHSWTIIGYSELRAGALEVKP